MADHTEPTGKKPTAIGFTFPQVVGSALAAATAAVLGSFLGVLGTIGGAAAAAIITTVGKYLYQRSLEATQDEVGRIKDHLVFRGGNPRVASASARPTRSVTASGAAPRRRRWTSRGPRPTPAPPTRPSLTPWLDQNGASGPQNATAPLPREDDRRALRRRSPKTWVALAAPSVSLFVIGLLASLGVETTAGRPFSGGSEGTTVGSLFGQPTGTTREPTASRVPSSDAPARPTTEPSSGHGPSHELDTRDQQTATRTAAPTSSPASREPLPDLPPLPTP